MKRGRNDLCPAHVKPSEPPPAVAKLPARPRREEPDRNPEYLRFVRSHVCAACGNPAETAHHHGKANAGGGTGRKGSDYQTVPLCHQHHQEYHLTGSVMDMGTASTEIVFYKAMTRCLDEWCQKGK